ncbi:MAG TPA: carotenoid biosynthesis protein [Actinomycetes bacterium]|nr:carotenoid biosynthesis protein [Actinomycetes bacterium]
MSVRIYTGPHADRHRGGGPRLMRLLVWLLTLGVVGLEIAYALAEGAQRRDLTIAVVVTFFLASTLHALTSRGFWWTAGFLVVTVGGGLAVEAIGVRTGWPFGDYVYASGRLGPTVLGVPVVIPLAWSMMAYPTLIAARTLCRGALTTPLVGAWALASWDLFLDPMMTGQGFWRFTQKGVALPRSPGVPLSNYAGWLLVAFAMMLLLDQLPRKHARDGAPAVLFLWTYVSSVVGNAFVFDRPWVAFYGGVAMGLVAIPYAWVLWSGRP